LGELRPVVVPPRQHGGHERVEVGGGSGGPGASIGALG
jgi:hypothetical protein